MRKILITGAAGYIGSVLTRQLLSLGYFVKGIDALFFGGESLIDVINHPNFEFINCDIRDTNTVKKKLEDVTDIVHLAAIVGDPACKKQPQLAEEINWEASKQLFDVCNNNFKIDKFIFASTCSNYGKMKNTEYVSEESELRPISLYAELKVKFEKYILSTPLKFKINPIILRFATVYGISARMRFDLTVNEFTRDAICRKELLIFGEQFWRPYCHVYDIARACVLALNYCNKNNCCNIYNVGDTSENYQKKMIAEEIMKIAPDTKINYIKKDEDPRDYKVDFSKIKRELNFKITKKVPDGVFEISQLIRKNILLDPYSSKYSNI